MLPFVPTSFGDIVAAVGIVHLIYRALSDSTGSSFEYRCLIEELHSFEDALHLVHDVLKATPLSESHRRAIEVETARCLKLLTKFWRRIQRYEVVVSGKWYTIWRKILWAMLKADEVASFRRKLLQHKGTINVFLNVVQMQGLALMMAKLDALQVGHGLENALVLVDALGERQTLPMAFCFSPDELHETLTRLFKDRIGKSHVARRDYTISTEDGKLMVGLNNWGAVVKKGTVIVMSVIVKKVALEGELAQRQRSACPDCDETDAGVMPDDGWLQCRRCAKRFFCGDRTITEDRPPQEKNTVYFRNIHVILGSDLRSSPDCMWPRRLSADLASDYPILSPTTSQEEFMWACQFSRELASEFCSFHVIIYFHLQPLKTSDDLLSDGQMCLTCGSTSTPEWRRGPMGPRTLCNACGIVYVKLVKRRFEERYGNPKSGAASSSEGRVGAGRAGQTQGPGGYPNRDHASIGPAEFWRYE